MCVTVRLGRKLSGRMSSENGESVRQRVVPIHLMGRNVHYIKIENPVI